MTDEGSGPGPEKPVPQLNDFFWVGTGCALSIVVAGGIGYGLDSVFGTLPWLTFFGLAFGVVSAVLIAVTQVRKFL
jgi:Putative F0F1-ATPase subunit Ca2+/Mg2+ transporter